MRKTSKAKGSEAQLALYDKRTKLQKEIDQFHQSSLLYLPPLDPATIAHKDKNDWVDEDDDDDLEHEHDPHMSIEEVDWPPLPRITTTTIIIVVVVIVVIDT